MKNDFVNKLRNRHEQIFKVALFIVAASLVVFLLPKEGKFKYEFQKNKPWVHEDLLAPFDFAINKSQEEIYREKNDLIQKQALYFEYKKDVINKAKTSYENYINTNWKDSLNEENKLSLIALGASYIDTLYLTGIIELVDELESREKDDVIFLVKDDNVGVEVELNQMFTIKSAYDYVTRDLQEGEIEGKQLIIDGIESVIKQNVRFNQELTVKDLESQMANISLVKGGVYENEKIISKGEIVSEDKFAIIQSLKDEYEIKVGGEEQSFWLLMGQIILVLIFFYAIYIFLKNVSDNVFHNNLDIGFMSLIIVGFFAITSLVLKIGDISVYVIPYCIIPLLIRTFFGNRLALFLFLIVIFLVSFIVPNPFEFIVLQMITGIITLFTVLNVNKRAELFYTSFIIFLVISVSFFGFSLIQEANINNINWYAFGWFGIAAGFTLLTYPLIYIFEKVFGYISDVTLLELADTNNKLLRELNLKAPGTFQHSLQVSNLAEEAVQVVGGNPLLVRTGALYHDIGKMYAPAYFIENQTSGINPHDELSYEESADIIINHVIKGIELAKEYNLPDQIIDFIRTHHGTTKTQYFLRMYKNENPEEVIDEEMFQYPGPIPYSKETAVLMMADSVEAASRSLKEYDGETIAKLVNGIIDGQVNQNQFINTNITFNDVTLIKKMFIKKLMNIYHVRIEYPK